MDTDDNSECKYYQEIIKERQYEREDVQEKTFTKWINAQLNRRNIKPVKDLFKDLRDGRVLIQLMEILTNTSLKPEIGKLRVHHIGNVNKTLDLLRDYGIRLINVNSNDIVDGNKKLTLALIWAVILTWQVKSVLQKVHPNCNFETIEKTLVTWCRDQTIGYKKVKIQDFSSSWKDGLAFNALLHRKNPNLFDYDLLIDRQPNENLEHAFKIAKENYGVDQYLDVEDFINGEPDKKSIMVYVMSLLECDSISKHQWLESRNDNKHEFELFVYNANQLMDLLRNAMIGCTIELNEDIDRRFLKESYHSREVFMQHISSLEEQTTEVKRLADQFASDSTLSSTENNEANYIQQMIVDLWRKLKLRVDEYNKSLHRLFISDQITVLEELESWVQQTEEQITRLSGALSYPSEYKSELQQNLHTLRLLERAMQSKQSDVSELESMLKSSSIYEDDDKNYIDDDLRKRITKLSDNWCTIARFVENNLITAQENLIYIKEMDEELAHCERWLNDKERCLNEISHANTDDEAQAKIAMLKINVICKEADFIKTILEKMTSKQSESTTSDHEKGCKVNAILTSVLRFKERRQRISSECERLSSCIRRGYVRKGKNNEIKAFNTEAANHNQMTEEDRITYVEKVRSSFYSECTRVLNWLEEVETILDGQAFQELDSHKQYSALTELIQKFNRYNRDFSELSRIGENLQTLITDTNEMENVSNMHTDIKERWLHLEDKVNQIRKNASLKIDESYVRNELQPVEDGVNDLSRLYLSNETQVDGEQIKPKEHSKTIRIYQERIEYLQKLLYNMEKEHGQGSANSLNALLANCKQKFNAVQIKIGENNIKQSDDVTIHHLQQLPVTLTRSSDGEAMNYCRQWIEPSIERKEEQRIKDYEHSDSINSAGGKSDSNTAEEQQGSKSTANPDMQQNWQQDRWTSAKVAGVDNRNVNDDSNQRNVVTVHERRERTVEHDETTTYSHKTASDQGTDSTKYRSDGMSKDEHDSTSIETESAPKMLHTLTNIYQFPSDSNGIDQTGNLIRMQYRSAGIDSHDAPGSGRTSGTDNYTIQSIVEIVEKPSASFFSGKLNGSNEKLNFLSDDQPILTATSTIRKPISIQKECADYQNSEKRIRFVRWLSKLENQLLNDVFEISTIDRMENRKKDANEVREVIMSHGKALDDIRDDYQNRAPQMNNEERRSCEWELNNLADRLTDAARFVKDRSRKYTSAIKQLSEYEHELSNIKSWFERVENSIAAIRIPAGDTHMLQSQIHKANDLLDEAKSSQSNIDSLSESAREISRHACHDLTSRLREDGDSIARQWSDIVSRIKDYTIKLEQALRRNRGFEDHIQELEIWISDKNREVPTDDNPIYYAEQISERLAKFQHIRNEISRKEQTLNSLVEESKPVLTSASSGTAKELTDDIDKLLSNFNNLTRKLDQKIKNHEEIQHIYNDLKDLMDDESEWLKQLQMETFSSIGAGATSLDDASRELDALERLVKNHPRNNRKRIRDLKKSLDSKRVVIPALGNQITQFEFRWDQLHEDALKRIQVLEESVIESKRTEQQTRKLQDWMNHVDELLNTKIERISQNDMDLLREEFEESARTLDMLNDKISFLRISGKSEAARRLDDQVVCLRKRYNELHQKYRQCQIPSDFEPNLERCRRVVHEVEQNIHAVDIKSDDPDIIQMQLDSCMKLYNILFEIQPEVENVIRAGRRITDNGSVENPELIIRQISNLKQSFNDMGTKVTAGKERLERSLRSLRRFHREHKQIVDWLNKAEDEIARLEAQPELQAANDQIDWIRSTKVDIRKLDSNFEILRSLQRDSEKEADKPLIGLTDKINSVERRVEQFSRRLRERTNRIEEQQNQVEDLYLKFSRLYDDLQSKLDYLDSLLYNVERHYEKGIIEQIKSELEAVRTNIENLRNLARVLTTQTDRYTNIVTPDVDNLYRRIDECNERLNIVQDTHTKRHATASIPVTVSVGSSEQHTSRSNQNKQFVENSRYYDESMTTTTTSGERRRRSRHKRDVSLSESTDEELTDDEFRKKYGRCLAYLQLIDKLVSKGALSSDSGELANLRSERKGGRVVDREMIERVIKETERTIHVIERKEPNRARKLRDMLCRLEEQLHRIESKIDAQGSVSPSNVTGTKFDKGVSRSTLVDGYDSSDFIYSTDFAVDDRSVASEPVVYPPTARGQRYSRFDKWHTISNRQQEREGSVKLQPLLRVRSLRAVDRHVQQESSYAGGIDQHNQQGGHTLPVMRNQRRYHSLERGALTKTAAHQYGQHMRPIFYAPICATPALFTSGYCHPTMSAAMIGTGGQFPIYRERIVDKHIAYREQAADSSAIRRDAKEGSAADVVMSRREIPRAVPVRIVHSSDDYHNESSMMTSVNESSRRFDTDHKVGGFGTIGTDSSAASYHHDNAVNVSTKIR